jgi:hypothetical protein
VSGDEHIASWIADKLKGESQFTAVSPTGSGFFDIIRSDGPPFTAVALGVPDLITREHVVPLFEVRNKRPEFVVNVPSKAIWSGTAINLVHDAPAAFGTLGELVRASREERVCTYRHREYNFFERAFRQHTAVHGITRLYDKVFQLHRHRGLPDITVALIDAYDMSAEDIRNARDLYGRFDAAVKISSYGSITTAASEAAESMNAEAFKFGELMGRLNKR